MYLSESHIFPKRKKSKDTYKCTSTSMYSATVHHCILFMCLFMIICLFPIDWLWKSPKHSLHILHIAAGGGSEPHCPSLLQFRLPPAEDVCSDPEETLRSPPEHQRDCSCCGAAHGQLQLTCLQRGHRAVPARQMSAANHGPKDHQSLYCLIWEREFCYPVYTCGSVNLLCHLLSVSDKVIFYSKKWYLLNYLK